RTLISLVFATVFLQVIALPGEADSALLIGLSTGDDRAVFAAPNAQITLISSSGGKASFRSTVNVVALSPGVVKAGSVNLKLPVTVRSNALLRWNNRPYRGHYRLVQQGAGFNVVNVVGVEDYLKGVLKMEVNPAWPMESLKAQTIIARTYALRNRGRHGSSGFDLCALSHCQVYRGVNAEERVLSKSVDQTRGQVLKYQGALAATFYHADSGGHTADVSSVWGSSIPYLKGSPEPMKYQSPYSSWTTTMRLSEIQRSLSSKGINVGKLTGISISSIDSAGRTANVTLTGTSGRTTIRASQFRTIVGPDRIRSTFFSIGRDPVAAAPAIPYGNTSPGSGEDELIPLNAKDEQMLIAFTQQGLFKTEELMDMLIKPEKRGLYLRKALERQSGPGSPQKAPSFDAPVTGDTVTFSGRGWGHGVGLSQWGAKSLAESGWDHRKILKHYFPGTEISRISN
ncbi:MAG TPA: stage II sporulation protein SpoIID, partial [Synergistaceae bacterium]|nr:stage II sporulation protein SpoIID [Synergistaceae bacterium]